MSFLWPLWLWAGAAVAVPVAIHLLSRGRGRTVSIGTVRFLPTSRSHRLRKIRPSGLLRLLLRSALIASLAVALAGPRFWSTAPAAPGERWLFVDPALVVERDRLEAGALETYRQLDTASATERRLLAPGLPRWDGGPVDAPLATDLWSLASEADALAPPEAALEFFVLDRAASVIGARPALVHRVAWWAVTDPEPNRWVQRAVRTADGIEVTIGTGNAQGTRFSHVDISPTSTATDLLLESTGTADLLQVADGGSRPGDDVATVPFGRPPLVVSIETGEDRTGDAPEVLRATTAVAAHLGRPLALATESEQRIDLAIALGVPSGSVPAAVRVHDSDEGRPCRQSAFVPELADPWLTLGRCSEVAAGAAMWRGGWGQPLLTVETTGDGSAYRWHGRFDPAWSSVTEAGLPHLLLDLVAPDNASTNGAADATSDRRAPVAGHSSPTSSTRPPRVVASRLPERIAWLLAVVLFIADRLLVRRAS